MHLWEAMFLSTLAGLSTVLGGVAALALRKSGAKTASVALGFAGGVMLALSVAELLPHGWGLLASGEGGAIAALPATVLALALGAAAAWLAQTLLPDENVLLARLGVSEHAGVSARLWRAGLFSAAALLLHNLPEGMATFLSAVGDLRAGLTVACGVALHSIPEGLALGLPLARAGRPPQRVLAAAALCGLAEPLGALLAWGLLAPLLTKAVLGALFCAIAGLMAALSLSTLLPAAVGEAGWEPTLSGAVFGALALLLIL